MNSPPRQQLLARDLMQCREHHAENALFNRQAPSLIVRQQLEQYRINQAAQPDPACFVSDVAESEPASPPLTGAQIVMATLGWAIVMVFACWLAGGGK